MWNRCHYEPDNPAPVFQGRTAKIVTRVGKLQHCDMEQRPPNVVYKADRLSIDQRFGLANMSARRGDRGEAPAMANGSHVAGGREALEYPPHSLMHGDCSGRARGEDAEANPASIDINRPFAIDTRGMSPNYDNSILWAHQSRPRDVPLPEQCIPSSPRLSSPSSSRPQSPSDFGLDFNLDVPQSPQSPR